MRRLQYKSNIIVFRPCVAVRSAVKTINISLLETTLATDEYKPTSHNKKLGVKPLTLRQNKTKPLLEYDSQPRRPALNTRIY